MEAVLSFYSSWPEPEYNFWQKIFLQRTKYIDLITFQWTTFSIFDDSPEAEMQKEVLGQCICYCRWEAYVVASFVVNFT